MPDSSVVHDLYLPSFEHAVLLGENKIEGHDAIRQVTDYLSDMARGKPDRKVWRTLVFDCDTVQLKTLHSTGEMDPRAAVSWTHSQIVNLWTEKDAYKVVSSEAVSFVTAVIKQAADEAKRSQRTVMSLLPLQDLQAIAPKCMFGALSNWNGRVEPTVVVQACNDAAGSSSADDCVFKGFLTHNQVSALMNSVDNARKSLPDELQCHVLQTCEDAGRCGKYFLARCKPMGVCDLSEFEVLFSMKHEPKWVRSLFDPLFKVIDNLVSQRICHGDIKPANVVLYHPKGARSLNFAQHVGMLIDFPLGDDQGLSYSLWFASRRTLSALAKGEAPTLQHTDDKESLFWTALDVCTKGGIRREGKRVIKATLKQGGSPTQKSIKEQQLMKECIFTTRRNLIAGLAPNGSFAENILRDCGRDALDFLQERLPYVQDLYCNE